MSRTRFYVLFVVVFFVFFQSRVEVLSLPLRQDSGLVFLVNNYDLASRHRSEKHFRPQKPLGRNGTGQQIGL